MKTNETYVELERERGHQAFVKFHPRLFWLFEPEETAFVANMLYLAYIRQAGGKTVYSKRELMEYMNMGERVFDRCVSLTTVMGLLERKRKGNKFDYRWNMKAYGRLLDILHMWKSPAYRSRVKKFLEENFFIKKRTVLSISAREIRTSLEF